MAEAEVKRSYSFERGEGIYITVGSTIRIAVDWSQFDNGSIGLPIEEWQKLKDSVDAMIAARELAMNAMVLNG